MTRDQLFALPVGTRLIVLGKECEITAKSTVSIVLATLDDNLIIGKKEAEFLAFLSEVIPGELDASEGVE